MQPLHGVYSPSDATARSERESSPIWITSALPFIVDVLILLLLFLLRFSSPLTVERENTNKNRSVVKNTYKIENAVKNTNKLENAVKSTKKNENDVKNTNKIEHVIKNRNNSVVKNTAKG